MGKSTISTRPWLPVRKVQTFTRGYFLPWSSSEARILLCMVIHDDWMMETRGSPIFQNAKLQIAKFQEWSKNWYSTWSYINVHPGKSLFQRFSGCVSFHSFPWKMGQRECWPHSPVRNLVFFLLTHGSAILVFSYRFEPIPLLHSKLDSRTLSVGWKITLW